MSRAFCCDALLCGSVSDAIRPVLAVPGAQRGPKGGPKMIIFTCWPFRAPKQPRSFHPLEFSGFLHKRPRSIVSPSGLRPISAVCQNAFQPNFNYNYNLGALVSAGASLLLGASQVICPFRSPRVRKTTETARFGPSAGKTELTAAKPPNLQTKLHLN